jgi:hypothetical protein
VQAVRSCGEKEVTSPAFPQPLYARSTPARDRRRAAAREALAKMKGDPGWIAKVDDSSLDFLATDVSEPLMRELASRWVAPTMGYPTSSSLAAMAERFYLQAAVAALDA